MSIRTLKMENILPIHLQEIIFGSADSRTSKQISRLLKEGKIRKIAARVYSSNLIAPVEEIIRRNLFQILGKLYPGALLSHRSAFEFQPTKSGQIFLTYTYTKKINLPGITIRFLEGHKPIEGDYPISGKLYASQKARAFLENLQPSKKKGDDSKCLALSELEEKLEQIIRVNGEEEINRLRDQARAITTEIKMEAAFARLDKVISALLTTHPSKILSSPLSIARAFGAPYDPARMELFEVLFRELQKKEFNNRLDRNMTETAFRNVAFYEF